MYYTIPIIEVRYPPNPKLRSKRQEGHDLALMVLKRAAKYSDKICPICLPKEGQDFSGMHASAVGWGLTGKDDGTAPALKVVNLVVSKKQYKNGNLLGTLLSVDEETFQDPCAGDSGKDSEVFPHMGYGLWSPNCGELSQCSL